jgi:flagellar hook-basal body complex protein FliE
MAVNPTSALATGARDMTATGAEWRIGGIESVGEATGEGGGQSFGDMVASSLGSLTTQQQEAAGHAQALATGQAEDVSSVVMAVERARLSMQLASQLRQRGVEAYQEIFRTTV